ncbi:TetR/AcrR family transcriptional regulator [Sphingomonas sp. RP10(2022)]|uniref:TetR/AcrR family transcriptional regulator n=1 Tax=Sphingomonas liriopis TaxID=2949094 RepID=A0A9X2HWF1_9SPHN|nr:TetR/AcrR family transcriptional regulator [Sphingomonas liriopis]
MVSRAPFGESGWATELKRSRIKREPPTAGRGLDTFDRILASAAELLGEVGFERMSTNDVCGRAEITPPALYHYFYDKYDILEELALRLLKRQNDAFHAWLSGSGIDGDTEARVASLARWFRIAAEVTGATPGSLSILRALRALPGLAHIRLASQRMLSDQLCDIYMRLNPASDRQIVWCRMRISCEFGYMVDEMALEEGRIANDVLFSTVASMLVETPPSDAV